VRRWPPSRGGGCRAFAGGVRFTTLLGGGARFTAGLGGGASLTTLLGGAARLTTLLGGGATALGGGRRTAGLTAGSFP
jgi:hypothetical protein